MREEVRRKNQRKIQQVIDSEMEAARKVKKTAEEEVFKFEAVSAIDQNEENYDFNFSDTASIVTKNESETHLELAKENSQTDKRQKMESIDEQ